MGRHGAEAWQFLAASFVLMASAIWAISLNAGLFVDSPTRGAPGIILVEYDAKQEDLIVDGRFSGTTDAKDESWGRFEIVVTTETLRPRLGRLSLLLCGPMSQAVNLVQTASTGDEPMKVGRVTSPRLVRTIDTGVPLKDCLSVKLRIRGTSASVGGQFREGWVTNAGDKVLYTVPGIRPRAGTAGFVAKGPG